MILWNGKILEVLSDGEVVETYKYNDLLKLIKNL